MEILNLDTSFTFGITIKELHSWGFSMEFKNDGSPITPTGVWKMVIYDQSGEIRQTLASNVADSGLTISGTKLIFDRTVALNILSQGNYNFEIRHDEGGYSTPVSEGPLTSNSTKATA